MRADIFINILVNVLDLFAEDKQNTSADYDLLIGRMIDIIGILRANQPKQTITAIVKVTDEEKTV